MREKEKEREEGEREGMKARLCRALDLLPDTFGAESCVEIRGRGSVTVSGTRKILTYTPALIRLAIPHGALRIEGEGLLCTSYFSGSVGIDGRIDRVCFEEGR